MTDRYGAGNGDGRGLADTVAAMGLEGAPLDQLCHAAVRMLGVTGAAVILMSDAETGSVVAQSGPGSATLEDLQFTLGEGPCLAAFEQRQAVSDPDLRASPDLRWPTFTSHALDLGARAVFALPLVLGVIRLGVLYLYRDAPGWMSDREFADALGLATLATDEILTLQAATDEPGLAPGLEGGWAHRAIVHAAAGMVATQLSTTLPEALARIRDRAAVEGCSVYSVAGDVVRRSLRFEQ